MTNANRLSPGPWAPIRFAVAGTFFLNGFALGSWTPQVPVVGARMGLEPAAYGFMILLFGLGAVAAMPAIGAMIVRLGSKPPLLITQVLLGVAFPFILAFPHPLVIGAALFLYGVGLGGMDVAMNANAVSVERSLGRAIMSSCHGFWSLGAVAGSGLGGILIETFGAFAHAALVGTLVILTLAVITPRLLSDRRAPVSSASAAGPASAQAGGYGRAPILLAIAIGFMALAGFVQEGVVIDWSAVYLRQDLGVSLALSGFGFATFSLAMAAFRFAGDRVRERYGAVRTLRASLLFALAGALVLATATTLPVALAGFLVLGVGLSNVVPIAFSAAGNVEGLKDGTGISIASGIAYAGGLVAPSAIGLIAAAFSFSAIFAGLGVIALLLMASARLVARADRPALASAEDTNPSPAF